MRPTIYHGVTTSWPRVRIRSAPAAPAGASRFKETSRKHAHTHDGGDSEVRDDVRSLSACVYFILSETIHACVTAKASRYNEAACLEVWKFRIWSVRAGSIVCAVWQVGASSACFVRSSSLTACLLLLASCTQSLAWRDVRAVEEQRNPLCSAALDDVYACTRGLGGQSCKQRKR